MTQRQLLILMGVVSVVLTAVYWTAQPIYEDTAWMAGHLRLAHLRTLALHLAATVLLVEVIAVDLDRFFARFWGAVFLLHPLAIPALGYATAWREMVVACGILLTVFLILRWSILTVAVIPVVLGTLLVKPSALGIGLVVVVLIAARWRYGDWPPALKPTLLLIVMPSALVMLWIQFHRALQPAAIGGPTLDPAYWRHVATQSTAVVDLFRQSLIPFGIAFQGGWSGATLSGQIVLALILLEASCAIWYGAVRQRRWLLGLACALAVILPRILLHTAEWTYFRQRGPEVLYTQQWYPALPCVIWSLAWGCHALWNYRGDFPPRTQKMSV